MSLSSRLDEARTHGEPLALTSGRRRTLPQRARDETAASHPAVRHGVGVLAAMERAVEREHPAFRVTMAAALASVAARHVRLDGATGAHLPGNGAASADEGRFSLLPVPPQRAVAPVPPAFDLLALRASGPAPGDIVLDPCAACGGPTRVAAIDLTLEAATLECVSCGLRRRDVAASRTRPGSRAFGRRGSPATGPGGTAARGW